MHSAHTQWRSWFFPGNARCFRMQFLGLRLVVGRDHDPLEGSEAGRLSTAYRFLTCKTPSWARPGTQRTWLIKAGARRDHSHLNQGQQLPPNTRAQQTCQKRLYVFTPLVFHGCRPLRRNQKNGQGSVSRLCLKQPVGNSAESPMQIQDQQFLLEEFAMTFPRCQNLDPELAGLPYHSHKRLLGCLLEICWWMSHPCGLQLDFISFLAWKQGPQALQVTPGKDVK